MSCQTPPRQRRIPVDPWLAALLAAGAIAGAAALVLLREPGGNDSSGTLRRAAPELVSVEQLQELAASLDGPVYWVGPREGVRYELSRTQSGRIYIRYLPAGVEAGDPRGDFLTVGTYPAADAFAAARRSGRAAGGVESELGGGGVAVYNRSTPTSVFLAFPGIPRLIEVYDRSAPAARRLVRSGGVVQILPPDAPPERSGRPVAVTEEELRALAEGRELPLYWAGPKPGVTYELTRLPDGQTFVRYLPAGVGVGDRRPDYLSVGTYPARDGPAEARAAAGDDAVALRQPDGATAFYGPATPTNIHFAPADAKFQVEVFHPDPGEARRILAAGEVEPVG